MGAPDNSRTISQAPALDPSVISSTRDRSGSNKAAMSLSWRWYLGNSSPAARRRN